MKKGYWFIIILAALLLPLGLYGLIKQPLGFNAIGGKDAPQVWLMFWATYISAIASFVMVFITWRTLSHTLKQHEANKQLHINTVRYTQELEQLNRFRSVCMKYIELYLPNNIMRVNGIINMGDVKLAHLEIGKMSNDISRLDTKLSFYKKESDGYNNDVMHKVAECQDILSDIYSDIDRLIVCRINKQELHCDIFNYKNSAAFIATATEHLEGGVFNVRIAKILNCYANDLNIIYRIVRLELYTLLRFEENRINNILLNNNNSEYTE